MPPKESPVTDHKSNTGSQIKTSGALSGSDFEKFEAPNHEKYESKNPIARAMTNAFKASLEGLLALIPSIQSVHEVGCGEGYLSPVIAKYTKTYRGSDLSPRLIEKAVKRADVLSLDCKYQVKSIYDLRPEVDSAEVMICCEVLEHLEHPEDALKAINNLNFTYGIFSVPREPIWCTLNMMRGKYLWQLGNTPGHIQHWSKRAFTAMLGKNFEIVKIKSPLPWTMVLVKKRLN